MDRRAREPWKDLGYSDIVAGRIVDGLIEVGFANGDEVAVPLTRIGLHDATEARVDLNDATKVIVAMPEGDLDVDWMQIRAATDAAFAKELRRRDAEEARRLGLRLKALREDRGLRQGAIAKQVGMTAPQLSKIERGQSDLRISTVSALLRAMNATFQTIVGPDAPQASLHEISRAGQKLGLPRDLMDRLVRSVPRERVSALLERAIGRTTSEVLEGQALSRLGMPVAFKAARNQQAGESPLLHLAYTASSMAASVAGVRPLDKIERNPSRMRARLLEEHGEITLRVLLRAVWDLRIVVIPMSGSGGFSAVAWQVDGRPSIVLKEARDLMVGCLT